MKRSTPIPLVLLSILVPSFLFAAPPPIAKGDIELSTAASATVTRQEGGTHTLIVLPIRVGAFRTDRLEIEVEGLLSASGPYNPGVVASGLLSWHFPASGGDRPYTHFLLVGAGVANTIPESANFAVGGGDEFAAVLNLGGGMKTFLAKAIAVRLEYRYQRYMFDRFPQSNHMVLVGFSYFTRR